MANTVYLITGANRGIGRGIVAELLLRPNTTVVAGVREPTAETSASLPGLPAGAGSRLVLLQLRDPAHYAALAATLADASVVQPPLARLDVVVANAGHSDSFGRGVLDTTPEDVLADMAVNAVGAMRLFQAVFPLLQPTGAGPPKFILMSSTVGSIATLDVEPMPGGVAYGMSKAAANWYAKKVAVDHPNITVGVLHPGWVQTPMGQRIADTVNIPVPPMTVADSARLCLQQMDAWTPERTGTFRCHRDEVVPW